MKKTNIAATTAAVAVALAAMVATPAVAAEQAPGTSQAGSLTAAAAVAGHEDAVTINPFSATQSMNSMSGTAPAGAVVIHITANGSVPFAGDSAMGFVNSQTGAWNSPWVGNMGLKAGDVVTATPMLYVEDADGNITAEFGTPTSITVAS